MVIALEPTEAIRVLSNYGNPETNVLCNTRPIRSIAVISGEVDYPTIEDMKKWISELSKDAWFFNATDAAMKMGNPIFGNIMLVGALAGTNVLPLDREGFEKIISETMPPDKVESNLSAYDAGVDMVRP